MRLEMSQDTLGASFDKPAIKKNTIHEAERGGWSVDVIVNLPLFFQPEVTC
jgi:hypothetical protein